MWSQSLERNQETIISGQITRKVDVLYQGISYNTLQRESKNQIEKGEQDLGIDLPPDRLNNSGEDPTFYFF